MDVGLSIQTYNGPTRVGYLLRSLKKAGWPPFPVYVFEDPSSDKVWEDLQIICKDFTVKLGRRPSWGNMQGCFQYAMEQTSHDLTILMSDDILPFSGWWEEHLAEWEKYYSIVGASVFSHWNCDDLIRAGYIDCRDEFYSNKIFDLVYIPKNTYFETGVIHAVHGSCFALRRDVWEDQGGFAQDFLAKDEDISRKIWINTNLLCMKFPSRTPLLHLGAAAQAGDLHPEVHTQKCSYQSMPIGLGIEEIWKLQLERIAIGQERLNRYQHTKV